MTQPLSDCPSQFLEVESHVFSPHHHLPPRGESQLGPPAQTGEGRDTQGVPGESLGCESEGQAMPEGWWGETGCVKWEGWGGDKASALPLTS